MVKNSSIFFFALTLLFLQCFNTKAQSDSLGKISVNAYAETYYIHDFSNQINTLRPSFFVSHHLVNEYSLNIGTIKCSFEKKRFKSTLALMTGSYVEANLAQEPKLIKNIYEANATLKLFSNKDLYLLAGIFNSHIGFESAIGADCYTLTRSIAADNSPYYESGLCLNYKKQHSKWYFGLLLLNGWQNIKWRNQNSIPSVGTQITFTNPDFTFNSSNYFGNEGTNSLPVWRYFHNFYIIKNLTEKSKVVVDFDIGVQVVSHTSKYHYWYSPQLVYIRNVTKKMDAAFRIEHYSDNEGVVVRKINSKALNVIGLSCNFDYKLNKNIVFRLEFKQLQNRSEIFNQNATVSSNNSSIAGACIVKL